MWDIILISLFGLLLFVDFCAFTFFDRYIASFFGLLAIGVGAYFFLPWFTEFIQARGTDWRWSVTWILIYLGVGVGVATIKWLFFNLRVRRKLIKLRSETTFDRQDYQYDVDYAASFEDHAVQRRKTFSKRVENYSRDIYKGKRDLLFCSKDLATEDAFISKLTPKAADYVDRVSFWVLQWPFVAVGFVFEDILAKIGVWLSDLYDAVFTNIARRIVGSSVKGM
jgi:hypothetical protein